MSAAGRRPPGEAGGNPELQHQREEILSALRKALSTNGDFPERMKAVSELRVLVADPNTTVNQVASHILREATLGTRILQLVNSAIYRRQTPILTVTQAIVHVGMRTLSDLCASLMLFDQFSNSARNRPDFSAAFQRTLLTGVISGSCAQVLPDQSAPEKAYLAGVFSEIGTLLLSFYFPEIAANIERERAEKSCDRATALRHITGLTAHDLNTTVMEALGIPTFYREVLGAAEVPSRSTPASDSPAALGIIVKGSSMMASSWIDGNRDEVNAKLAKLQKQLPYLQQLRKDFLDKTAESFEQNCSVLGVTPLATISAQVAQATAPVTASHAATPPPTETAFARYLQSLEQAIFTSASLAELITRAMEAVVFGLSYDRAYLFLTNNQKTALCGRLALGEGVLANPRELAETINDQSPSALVQAFQTGEPRTKGTSLMQTRDAFAAIPLGTRPAGLGVIYAEKSAAQSNAVPLTELNLLAQMLEQAIVNREQKTSPAS